MKYRSLKVLLSALVALHISLIAFNNITDYDSNFRFVQGVMSMEDVFSGGTRWRAWSSDIWHHFAYLIIIAIECAVSVLMWTGTIRQWMEHRGTHSEFELAGRWSVYGLMLGLTLWFGMFLSIGGEWFLMWQSDAWNAQGTAFQLTLLYLSVLLILQRRETRRTRKSLEGPSE